MKPDWKDAPEWAQYLAMNGDQVWWWFEMAPKLIIREGANVWASAHGRTRPASDYWYNTLEQRP